MALIKDAGDLKTLKTRLKDWEAPTGGLSAFISALKSLVVSKEQTSKAVDEATRRSRDTKDCEFLGALPRKVSKEPLLEQLTQDVVREAHAYFREFMERRGLHRLYSRAHDIKRQAIHHQVEMREKRKDQERMMSSRSVWFEEIKTAQAQVDQGCVLCCLWVYPTLKPAY